MSVGRSSFSEIGPVCRAIFARISAAYRSKYLLNVLGDVNGHDYTFVNASTNIDFSASYNVTPKLKVTCAPGALIVPA